MEITYIVAKEMGLASKYKDHRPNEQDTDHSTGTSTYLGRCREWEMRTISMRSSKLSCLLRLNSIRTWSSVSIGYRFISLLLIGIVAAGFDAAAGDQLGLCFVTPACYAHMTHMLMSLAEGKIVCCLEVRAISALDTHLLNRV